MQPLKLQPIKIKRVSTTPNAVLALTHSSGAIHTHRSGCLSHDSEQISIPGVMIPLRIHQVTPLFVFLIKKLKIPPPVFFKSTSSTSNILQLYNTKAKTTAFYKNASTAICRKINSPCIRQKVYKQAYPIS